VRWGRGGSSRRSHAAANVVPRAGLGVDDEQVHGVGEVDDLDHQELHVVVETSVSPEMVSSACSCCPSL
jgi:hypothetical protein